MENKDVYIKILEFGINRIKGFNYDEVIGPKRLKYLKDWEIEIIDKYFLNAYRNKRNNNLRKPTEPETCLSDSCLPNNNKEKEIT